jgi:hypothetical protein
VIPREASDDDSRAPLQDTQDLITNCRRGIESQSDELAAQRDKLTAKLRTAEKELSRKDKVIKDLEDQLQNQRAPPDTSNGSCEDASACWTDGDFTGGISDEWPAPSVVDGLMYLNWGHISEDDQSVHGDDVPQHQSWTTDFGEFEGDPFSTTTELPFSPRYCDQMPVALTNAGCELCPTHCKLFTWLSTTEMGMGPCMGLATCPACGGPGYKSAQLSGNLTD